MLHLKKYVCTGPGSLLATFLRMKWGEKILTVVLIAVFLLSVGEFAQQNFLNGNPQKFEDAYSEAVVGKIKNLNPLFVETNEVDRDLSRLIFSGLIKYDPITNNFIPDLAETWQRDGTGRIYTFNLKKNVLWHDGTPFTSDDVVFTFKNVIAHQDFKNVLLKSAFEGVSVSAAGPHKVDFTLTKPNSYFLSIVTVGLIPQHLLKDTPVRNLGGSSFNKNPVGTGPYRVESLFNDREGDAVHLEAFLKYYGAAPSVARFVVYTFPDEKKLQASIHALSAISRVRQDSTLYAAISGSEQFTLFPYTLNQFSALYFNTENPLLERKEVRQALSFALHKNALIEKGEQRIDTVTLETKSTEERFSYNLAKAQQALNAAQLPLDAGGVRTNNKGKKMSFTLLAMERTDPQFLEKIRQQWKAAGVEIKIQVEEPESFARLLGERRYDLLFIRQNLGYNRDIYPLFHSSQTDFTPGGTGGLNFSNFKSFRTDGLSEALRKEKDPTDKAKLLKEASDVLADEVPVIFISTPIYNYALPKDFKAFPVKSMDYHSDRMNVTPWLAPVSLI